MTPKLSVPRCLKAVAWDRRARLILTFPIPFVSIMTCCFLHLACRSTLRGFYWSRCFKELNICPRQCGLVAWASSPALKGCMFHFWSGHMPMVVSSLPGRGVPEQPAGVPLSHPSFSLSTSPFLSLQKVKI